MNDRLTSFGFVLPPVPSSLPPSSLSSLSLSLLLLPFLSSPSHCEWSEDATRILSIHQALKSMERCLQSPQRASSEQSHGGQQERIDTLCLGKAAEPLMDDGQCETASADDERARRGT